MDSEKLFSAEVRIRVDFKEKEDISKVMEKIKNARGIEEILPPKHVVALTGRLTSEQLVSLGDELRQIPEVYWCMFDFFPEEQKREKS